MDVTPVTDIKLADLIADGVARMGPSAAALWKLIRVTPTRWRLHPWADDVGGFWIVAVLGQNVLWYNEIEEGFNLSRFEVPGVIADYWCNQDELQHVIHRLVEGIANADAP